MKSNLPFDKLRNTYGDDAYDEPWALHDSYVQESADNKTPAGSDD